MQYVNHCITKALAETPKHTLFILEDLTGIRQATEKIKLKDRYFSVLGVLRSRTEDLQSEETSVFCHQSQSGLYKSPVLSADIRKEQTETKNTPVLSKLRLSVQWWQNLGNGSVSYGNWICTRYSWINLYCKGCGQPPHDVASVCLTAF